MADIFIDTSAFIALLVADDAHHASAKRIFSGLLNRDDKLLTHNYVVLETFSLLHSRIGLACARAFHQDILPTISIEWVQRIDHDVGIGVTLALGKRKLSLVDCVSFSLLRRTGIRKVFGFDRHFAEQEFEILQAPAG